MMKELFAVVLLSATVAVAGEKTPLWPEGKMPFANDTQVAAPGSEVKAPGFDRAAHRMPYLEWAERPSNPNGALVLILPGGGYYQTGDGAFRFVEEKLVEAGYACAWVFYRTPRVKGRPYYETAWADGQRAVRLVRAAAAERGYDPEKIGVVGCSAGGHLALLLGTSALTSAYARVDATDDLPCHVNWAMPICPAYVLTDGLGTRNAKGGEGEGVRVDSLFKFDAKTCPMCFFHGGLDPYSPLGSTQVYRRLRQMGIPAELHLDADRKHGLYDITSRFARGLEFMRQMNFDGRLGAPVALMSRYATDDDRASYEKQTLWPEGRTPNLCTNQCTPFIEWHLPKTLKTKAIQIIYSGGSYKGNGPDGFEVAPARRYLNARGMTVVTMKYRTPRPLGGLAKHVTAWQDLQRAVRLVRSQAKERGLDPDRIGIMGSSAGGHLTLMGVTSSGEASYAPFDEIDALPCNVQWAVAIYPAYALTDGAEHHNTTGGNDDSAVLVPEFKFDKGVCPMLFVHGDADGWAAMNSVKCWEKLRREGVQSDLHTLATRKHCFQKAAAPGTGSYTFLDRIGEFLTKKGFDR